METHRTRLAVALALVAIAFPTTFSAPATRSSCTPVCRQSQASRISYQEGKSYTYGFETEVITEVLGSSDEQSKIKVKGQAVIAAQSSCDFTLTVQQVAFQSPSGQAISKVDEIEGSSLRFSYQDGQVESVCVSEDDPTWSANVKRAIISMLTNTADKAIGDVTTETDISGQCPTTYSVTGDKYVKTRDLNSCTNRDGGAITFMGVPYNVPSKYNSLPVIDSALECTQDVKNGVFQRVDCVESHTVPFLSTQSTGVHTEIKSSLNLVATQDGVSRGSKVTTKKSSVLYDHSEIQDMQRQKASGSRAVDVLKKICQEIEDGAVSSKVPSLYLQLIKTLKTVRKEDVKQMYEKITVGGMCSRATEKLQKIFVDAAATSGSDGSIAFMSELILNDAAGCNTKTLFHTTAAFAPHPGVGALEALKSLISKTDVGVEYLLTASAVAHQYCRMTNDQCASNNEYRSLVDKIAQNVHSVNDEEGMRTVIAALQALGNLDQLTPAAVNAITTLLDDKSTSERLKVRALDAFRRDPCQQQLKQKAIKIFGDNKESSHVRIQAYWTISKCVEQGDINALQTILNGEQSNQVGSFVASHIENVIESASPSKQNVKDVFRQFTIPEGLRRDVRKFSRNSEYSTFLPQLNVGGSLEGNMIFSQQSYLPRMTSANLTIDAFGRSYNSLELGVYAEDFEHLVEKYFGPAGKMRKTNLEQIISQGSERLSRFVEGVRNRFKRDVKIDANQNEIDAIREQVDIKERIGDHGVGDIYIRIMGTSMLVETFNEANLLQGSLSQKLKKGIEKVIEGAKDHKFDMTNPVVFVDEELILPTFSGLPLNLEVKGTSIFSMQMNGNIDVGALFRSGPSDIRAKFVPSAATLLKARMTVGAGPMESGLQLEGKVHSAAGVDVKLVKEDGKFEFRFNLPQERTQIIDVRSDLYWVEQPEDSIEKKTLVQSKLITKSLINNNCMTTFSKIMGLKFCADMKIPQVSLSAPFPVLNGQTILSLSVEKSESSMEGYYLKIEKDTQVDQNFGVSFLMDTPGSRTNRKVSASLKASQYKSTTPEYVFNLESPWTKLDVDYKRSFTDDLKGFEIKVITDGDAYNGKLQLKKVKAGSVSKYEPIVQYSLPGGRPVKLIEGQVLRTDGERKVEIDLRTTGPMRSLRGSVKGTIEVPEKADGFEVKAKDLEFASGMVGKIAFDGHVTKGKHMLDTKIHAKYGSEKQHKFEFETKLEKQHHHYEFKTKTRSSRLSFLNFDAHGEVEKEGPTYKSELTYTRGLEEPKVLFSHKIKTTIESRKEFEIFHEAVVKHPGINLDMYSKFDAKAAAGQSRHAEMIFNVNSFKTNTKYESAGQNLLDYTVRATANYADKTYQFSETSSKTGDNKQNFKSKISVTPGFWYAADTDVTHKFEKSDMESTFSTSITSDTFSDPILFKTGVRGKSDGYDALMKLDMKGRNYMDFATNFKHAKASSPATLTMKNFVLNYLDAKLVHTLSRSQSELQVDIKWIPTGRKIESKSKVTKEGDRFNLDADLKWDAERDATKSASIKSVTNLSFSKLQFDSKNDITVEGKLAKLNLKGKAAKEWLNGEENLEIDYTSASGKTYNLATVLNLENKLKSKGFKTNVKLTLDGEKPYDFTLENRISNLNPHEMTFEGIVDMKMDYKGEKDVSFRAELGSVMPGNYRSYTGKIDIGGSVIPAPVSANVKADVKKGKWAVKGGVNRGSRSGDMDVVIEYDVWSPKNTLEVKYTINTPFDAVKTVEGVHKHGCLFNSLKNFEYTEEGSFALNHGSPSQWKYLTSVLNNEFKYLSEFMNDGKAVYRVVADGKLTGKKFLSDIQASYRDEKAFLNVDIDHQLPNLGFILKGGIPRTTFELKTTHKKVSEGIYETDVLAKTSDELAFRVTNKLEMTPTKKSVDLMLSAAEEPVRRVYLLVNQANTDKYNLEAMIRWGDGAKYLSTKGDLNRSTEGMDATMTLDSPALNANKMTVKLSKKSQTGRHAVIFKVQESNKDKFSAIFDYGTSLARSGAEKVYQGSVAIKGDKTLVDVNFNGKFKLEDVSLARTRGDDEDGRQLKGSFEVGKTGTPIKGSAVLKTSDKEKRVQISLCNEERGRCRSGDAHLRHQHDDNGDLEYSLRIVGETDASGQKSTTGVSIRTAKTEDGRQMDHTVKLILSNQNSEQVGYRFYRKDGYELGAELLLPERVIATVLDCKRPGPTDMRLDLSFFIDKTRQPNRKISLTLNTEKHKEHIGRDVEVIFCHPDMPKDLKVVTKYSLSGESGNHKLEVKTVLDIFKAESEIVMAYKAQREPSDVGELFKTQWSVFSKGQNINFGGKSEISAGNGKIVYKQELHYENREKQTKTAKIELLTSMNRQSFEVKGHSGKLVSLISTFEEHPTGYEHKQEVLLPGMEDARIFQAVLTTTSPRKAQLKTYTANSPAGVYYEAIIGFKTQDHFVAGLYDHEANGQNTLADFNVELNNNRILSMKTNWERDNVKKVWTKTQARADRNGKNLKQMVGSSLDEVVKELQSVGSNLKKSAPDVKDAINSAKTQFADLVVELDAHQDTKLIVEKFQAAQGFVKAYIRFLIGMTKAARRMALTVIYTVKEQIQQLPELLKDYTDKIPYTIEDVQKWAETFMDCFVDFTRKVVKLLEQTVDRLSNAMPEIIKGINCTLDMTSGITDTIRSLLKSALEKATVLWKSIRALTKDFIDNDMVRMFVRDTVSLFQMMLTEFIEETKEYAESFKNYVLKVIPESELQELIQLTAEYVEKKAKSSPVDDTAAIKEIYEKLVSLVKKVGAKYFSFDSSEGSVTASVLLPRPANSLSDVMKMFENFSFPSPPIIKYNLPSYKFGISEVINKIRHGACFDEFVPPYDAYALVIGSQFYKTFDGQFFRFDGGCQYLLASDLEDGNFTVVVNYDRKASKVERAIIVKDSSDTIAIKSDNTVVINGRTYTANDLNTEEPSTTHFKVSRIHGWIVATGDTGVKVGCSSLYDVCGVKVNGYYHGKVMGLLGKFNQEKFDDLTTVEGQMTDDINQFTESWKLDKQCTEQPVISLPVITSEASQRCTAAFENRSSTLRPCYSVVDPQDYQRICERVSSTPGYDVSKAVCTASAGYAKACRLSFANVDLPSECRRV